VRLVLGAIWGDREIAGSTRGADAAEGMLGGEGWSGCSGELSRAREHTRERENEARRGFTTWRSFGDGWTSRRGDGTVRRRWPKLDNL